MIVPIEYLARTRRGGFSSHTGRVVWRNCVVERRDERVLELPCFSAWYGPNPTSGGTRQTILADNQEGGRMGSPASNLKEAEIDKGEAGGCAYASLLLMMEMV